MAAKQTSNLIPLCHNINLSQVQITLTPVAERSAIHIMCEARCRGQTGVEMEALTVHVDFSRRQYSVDCVLTSTFQPEKCLKLCELRLS